MDTINAEDVDEVVQNMINEEDSSDDSSGSSSDEDSPPSSPATVVTATYSEPRPKSTVPLADIGKSPAELEAEQYKRVQEQQEEIEKEEGPTGVTKAEFNRKIAAETAVQIGKQNAERAFKNASKSATEKAKLQMKLDKAIDKSGFFDDEHRENCRKMNQYRDKYNGRINFVFKREYGPSMKPDYLKQCVHEVETILNTQDLPTVLKKMGIQVVNALEILSIAAGYEWFNLSGLTKDCEINAKSGYFDEELEQISIKWAAYFARPPEERLLLKLGMMIAQKIGENMTGKSVSNLPKTVPESMKTGLNARMNARKV